MKKLCLLLILASAVPVMGGAVPPFTTIFMRTLLDDPTQAAAWLTLGIGDTDGTLSGDSDTSISTEKVVKNYVDHYGGGVSPENIIWRDIRTDFSILKKGTSPPGEENSAIGASGNILAYNYAFNPAAGRGSILPRYHAK